MVSLDYGRGWICVEVIMCEGLVLSAQRDLSVVTVVIVVVTVLVQTQMTSE